MFIKKGYIYKHYKLCLSSLSTTNPINLTANLKLPMCGKCTEQIYLGSHTFIFIWKKSKCERFCVCFTSLTIIALYFTLHCNCSTFQMIKTCFKCIFMQTSLAAHSIIILYCIWWNIFKTSQDYKATESVWFQLILIFFSPFFFFC